MFYYVKPSSVFLKPSFILRLRFSKTGSRKFCDSTLHVFKIRRCNQYDEYDLIYDNEVLFHLLIHFWCNKTQRKIIGAKSIQ